MAIRDTRPADFMSFWDNAKAAASAIPMDGRIESCIATFGQDAINEYNLTNACLPADYDPDGHTAKEVESYKVSIAGPDGGRVYGWLAKPKGPGPFPAMLILPGGGFAARPRPLEHARHGYLALDIQIHGQDVDLSDYPTIPGHFSDQQYRPVDEYYYYKVHQRVIQAMNYLAFRTDVDAARIAVAGGSQGGRLGLVIAGLDNRVAAVVSAIAHSSNHPHLRWVDGCNGPSKSPVCDGMDLLDAPHLTRLRLRPTSYSM